MEFLVMFFMFIFIFAIVVAAYVINAMATVKCLKALGYDKPIAGWIPFYNQYALAEVTGFESVDLGFNIVMPMKYFKFWWAFPIVLNLIPVIGSIAGMVFSIAAGGWNYGMLYALTENRDYQEQKVLGYITAFVPVIAIVKFFCIKPENVVYKYGQGQPGFGQTGFEQQGMYNQPGFNPMYDNPQGFNPNFDQQQPVAGQPTQTFGQPVQAFGQQPMGQGYGQPIPNQQSQGQGYGQSIPNQQSQGQDMFANQQPGGGTFGQGVTFEQQSSDDPWAGI